MEDMITSFLINAIKNYPTASTLAAILIAFEGTAPMLEALCYKVASYTPSKADDKLFKRIFSSNIWSAAKSFARWLGKKKQ